MALCQPDILIKLFGRGDKSIKNPAVQKENLEKKKGIRRLVKKKEYQKALKLGINYLDDVPNDNDVLFIVGSIYYLQKRYKSALIHLDKALDIGSYDVDALILKANSHYFLGQYKIAKKCCYKILEVDTQNKQVKHLLEKLNL